MIRVPLHELPAGGLPLSGTVTKDIFQIEKDPDLPSPVVRYNLTAYAEDGTLVVDGSLEADFTLRCVRCLEPFPYRVSLVPYHLETPLKNVPYADLTEQVREDILLDLPGYPRCEHSNMEDRSCPQAGQFDSQGEGAGSPASSSPAHGDAQTKNVWDVLDDIAAPDEDQR